jgi:hypothetical protein
MDEPVKIVQYNCTCGRTMKFESEHGVVAPQRAWVGLTPEEIDEIIETASDPMDALLQTMDKLKEKNGNA